MKKVLTALLSLALFLSLLSLSACEKPSAADLLLTAEKKMAEAPMLRISFSTAYGKENAGSLTISSHSLTVRRGDALDFSVSMTTDLYPNAESTYVYKDGVLYTSLSSGASPVKTKETCDARTAKEKAGWSQPELILWFADGATVTEDGGGYRIFRTDIPQNAYGSLDIPKNGKMTVNDFSAYLSEDGSCRSVHIDLLYEYGGERGTMTYSFELEEGETGCEVALPEDAERYADAP